MSPSTKMLGDYLLTDWLPTIANRNLKASTYNSYESLVRLYIVPALGMDRLQELAPGRIKLVSIDYELEFSGPKNGRERQIALDSETVAVLREWKTTQSEERLAMGAL